MDMTNIIKLLFFFTKYDSLSISPLFDSNNNLNGYCYLFVKNPFDNKKFNDYSDLIYNDILIKIIYLIINNLKKKESSFYYLIKEKWFNIFKEKFFYEKTKNDINNNNIAKSYLKNFIDEENNISKEKDNIPFLKEIIFLINNIPQTNKFYNDNQERMISDEFQIEEPDLETYKNDIENYQFTIYNHFILIEKKIFEQIYYEKNLESKRNYCSCFYEEDLMFIKLNKQITGLVDKIVIEVGYIDYNENLFILKYLIIFDKDDYYNNFLKYLKNYGFQKFFRIFQFGNDNVKPLKIKGNKMGYICKYGKKMKNKK